MIRLRHINNNQTFNCISNGIFDQILLTDEQTKVTANIEPFTVVYGDYTNEVTANLFAYTELNHTYTIKMLNSVSGNVVFYDKVFVTNQISMQNFNMSAGLYTTNDTINEFVIYE